MRVSETRNSFMARSSPPPAVLAGLGRCTACENVMTDIDAVLDLRGTGDYGAGAAPVAQAAVQLFTGGPAAVKTAPDPKSPAAFIVRATNLASLTVEGVWTLNAKDRAASLANIGGVEWKDAVLKLMARLVSIGNRDALRFSLTLYYLLGIIDSTTGKKTVHAAAYTKAIKLFNEARTKARESMNGPPSSAKTLHGMNVRQVTPDGRSLRGTQLGDAIWNRKNDTTWQQVVNKVEQPNFAPDVPTLVIQGDSVRPIDTPGMGSQSSADRYREVVNAIKVATGGAPQSQAEIVYWANSQWSGTAQNPSASMVKNIKDARARQAQGQNYVDAVNFADRNVFTNVAYYAEKVVDAVANFTSDVLCKGFTSLFGDRIGGVCCTVVHAIFSFAARTLDAIFEVISTLGTGLVNCISLLVQGKTKEAAVALLTKITAAIFIVPPFSNVLAPILGIDEQRWKDIANKVGAADPLFPVKLAAAILPLVAGGVGPSAIAGIIEAVRVAVSEFVSDIASLRSKSINATELKARIDKVLSWCSGLVMGITSIKDIVAKIQANGVKKFGQDVMAKFEKDMNTLGDSLTQLNFKLFFATLADIIGMDGLSSDILSGKQSLGPITDIQNAFDSILNNAEDLQNWLSKMDVNDFAKMAANFTADQARKLANALTGANLQTLLNQLNPQFLSTLLDPAKIFPSFSSAQVSQGVQKVSANLDVGSRVDSVIALVNQMPAAQQQSFVTLLTQKANLK